MNNRNMVIFVVASILMLVGYNYAMNKFYPPKPAPAHVAVLQPAPAAVAQAPQAKGLPATAAVVDAKARFTLATPSLKLTWRKGDGALVLRLASGVERRVLAGDLVSADAEAR